MKLIVKDGWVFVAVTLVAGMLVAAAAVPGQADLIKIGRSEGEGSVMSRSYNETEAANLKKVKEGFEAWAQGKGSPYQLLDDNVSWTIVGNSLASREYKSRKEFIDEVISPFNARMSKPLVPMIRNIYADGDTVIIFFDAKGTAKDGKTYANTYSWFLRLKNGRINRAVAFYDSIHFNDLWTRVPVANQ